MSHTKLITKGIVLAGGTGTRLHPVTLAVNKHLLPVFDKPLVYYPLSALLLAGIRDLLVITTSNSIDAFRSILADGRPWGVSIQYATQDRPGGIAEAFTIGRDFIGEDGVALILGDNIFFGHGFSETLRRVARDTDGATIFGYEVDDPSHYGVVELDDAENPISLAEKPADPNSRIAVTGLYFYDNSVIDIAANLSPSDRGELEITDVNREYLKQSRLRVEKLGRGFAWLDAGTHASLLDASNFVATMQRRHGLKIACIEEIAFRMGFVTSEDLLELAASHSTYGDYLREVASGKH